MNESHRESTSDAGRSDHVDPLVVGAYGFKPRFRGRLHQVAFFVSLPAGFWLLAGAQTTTARIAVAIYWASLAGLFAASSSYHLFAKSERAVTWMRRLDHSMIFVLIAGTYTPFGLVVLPRAWGIPMLVAMWVTALAGIIMKMVRVTAEHTKSGSWLYSVLGWSAVIALPKLLDQMGPARMALLLGGGFLYTVGAIILGKRRPDPRPRVFGYHEVWHAFTIAAGACHFVLVAMVTH
ncbi:MAG TPA: hypothetical protein DEG43_03425 [Acidimicrobiaceae bacterium]|jgi:hemolysin III|nr:hypothetical protein [Acidimicrobiaceae bacterium]